MYIINAINIISRVKLFVYSFILFLSSLSAAGFRVCPGNTVYEEHIRWCYRNAFLHCILGVQRLPSFHCFSV